MRKEPGCHRPRLGRTRPFSSVIQTLTTETVSYWVTDRSKVVSKRSEKRSKKQYKYCLVDIIKKMKNNDLLDLKINGLRSPGKKGGYIKNKCNSFNRGLGFRNPTSLVVEIRVRVGTESRYRRDQVEDEGKELRECGWLWVKTNTPDGNFHSLHLSNTSHLRSKT